jgi:uncharacterized protein DUF4349
VNTDIEYLRQLETDLGDAAVREASRAREAATPARRRRPKQMWMRVAGVAAAFLVVAGAIGFLADGASDKFQQVGDAVAGGGGGEAPERAVGGPAPAAEPSPAPGTQGGIDYDPGKNAAQGVAGRHEFAGGGQQQDLSKIIRDGRIGVVVPDETFGDAVGELTFIAEEHGGFILSSTTQNERSGTFVLRIPARRFDRALAAIRALGAVRFQQVRGQDVTAEYIDLQARLRILAAQRTFLFELFQKADTITESLQLHRQLDDVQLRIEQIQGQINFINDQVSESTLRVSIQERHSRPNAPDPDVDNPDLGSSFDLAVQGFLRIVGAVIVGLGYLIPLTVLGALVWLAVWFVRRRRAA